VIAITFHRSSSFFLILLHSCILCASPRFWIPLDVKWQSGKWLLLESHGVTSNAWPGSKPHSMCSDLSAESTKLCEAQSFWLWRWRGVRNCDQIVQHVWPHDATRCHTGHRGRALCASFARCSAPDTTEANGRPLQSLYSVYVESTCKDCIQLYNIV